MKNLILSVLLLFFVLNHALGQDYVAVPKLRTCYLHTNKNAYFSGEKIWFSAFLTDKSNHQLQPDRQPLYVQLYNKAGDLLQKEMIYTFNGRGSGYIILPDSMLSEVYHLVAFTRIMLAKPDLIYHKQLSIINQKSDKVVLGSAFDRVESAKEQFLKLELINNKSNYKPRDEIKLKLICKDKDGNPIRGTFSISVNDDLRQVEKEAARNILDDTDNSNLNIARKEVLFLEKLPLLKAVALDGENLKPIINANVLLMRADTAKSEVRNLVSDELGLVIINNIYHEGTQNWTAQISDKRGKFYQNAFLQIIDLPHIIGFVPDVTTVKSLKELLPNLTENSIGKQDGVGYVVGDESILLDEVSIKEEKPAVNPNDVGVMKLYSNPTFSVTFDEKDPPMNNLEMMILRVPGIQKTAQGFASGGVGSLSAKNTLLFLVDGLEIADPSFINPNDISRIDLVRGAGASMYGNRGANGVLALYTRRFMGVYDGKSQINLLKIKGFQKQLTFNTPDYARPIPEHKFDDLRNAIYWNPEIITDEKGEAEVSFYAADLPSTYKIVIEGMSVNQVGRVEKTVKVVAK